MSNTYALVPAGTVVNFSSLQVDCSATLDAAGVLTFDTLINNGEINIASGNPLAVATLSGSGTVHMHTGAWLHLMGGPASGNVIDFGQSSGGADLYVDNPAGFTAVVNDFGSNTGTIFFPNGQVRNQLLSSGGLVPGEFIISASGRFILTMRQDGVLQQYDRQNGGGSMFSAGSSGPPRNAIVTRDGNLGLIDPTTGQCIWSLPYGGGHADAECRLYLGDDGNVGVGRPMVRPGTTSTRSDALRSLPRQRKVARRDARRAPGDLSANSLPGLWRHRHRQLLRGHVRRAGGNDQYRGGIIRGVA